MKHLLLLCLMVCSLSCNKEKRMMRDFDEITEVTLEGVQHTDKNDWQCDNEVPDKINDLWTRGEELEAELEQYPFLVPYYNSAINNVSISTGLNPANQEFNLFVSYNSNGKGLAEYIVIDEDINVLRRGIRQLEPDNLGGATASWFIDIERISGYPQTRVYYRIFTKQNGDVCIGHGDIRWE